MKNEDFYQEPEPEPQKVWVDELSDFPVKRVVYPQEYKLNTYTDLPKREKVMHPWSRRKKR